MFADRGEGAHEGTGKSGRRQLGPTSMSDPRNSLMMWIGAGSGLVGVLIYSFAQAGEMLPINRALLAIIGALMMIWLLVVLLISREGRR